MGEDFDVTRVAQRYGIPADLDSILERAAAYETVASETWRPWPHRDWAAACAQELFGAASALGNTGKAVAS